MNMERFNFDKMSNKGRSAIYYFHTVKLESWIKKMCENKWLRIKEYIQEEEAPKFLNTNSDKIFVVIAELHVVNEDTKESIGKLDSFEFVCETLEEAVQVGGELASYLSEVISVIKDGSPSALPFNPN